jgi:hypothetical protein
MRGIHRIRIFTDLRRRMFIFRTQGVHGFIPSARCAISDAST